MIIYLFVDGSWDFSINYPSPPTELHEEINIGEGFTIDEISDLIAEYYDSRDID